MTDDTPSKSPSQLDLLRQLVEDESFKQFAMMLETPNFFKAVGRPHKETTHSNFIAWLLDPRGSHRLGCFPLQQLLAVAIKSESAVKPGGCSTHIANDEQLVEMANNCAINTLVLPNERDRAQFSVNDMKFDVWIEFGGSENGDPNQFVLIEIKVDAALQDGQAKNYADYLEKRAQDFSGRGACIFIGRTESIKASSQETVDDPRWYCINYQILLDAVLVPCATHEDLDEHMGALLKHYILNLRAIGDRGRLAVTKEEREAALQLLRKHKDAFAALGCMLRDEEGFEADVADVFCPKTVEYSINIDDGGTITTITGTNPKMIYTQVFAFVSKKCDDIKELEKRTRRVISKENRHLDGSAFLQPIVVKHKETEYFIEGNASTKEAYTRACEFLKLNGFTVEQ